MRKPLIIFDQMEERCFRIKLEITGGTIVALLSSSLLGIFAYNGMICRNSKSGAMLLSSIFSVIILIMLECFILSNYDYAIRQYEKYIYDKLYDGINDLRDPDGKYDLAML